MNKNFQKDIQQFCKKVANRSQKSVRNWYKDFPQIATDALTYLDSTPLNDPTCVGQLVQTSKWPAQQFESGFFADLSFTLYRDAHFLLDMYVWYHHDTSIHDHHFSGAFKVVTGNSYHISYEYHAQTKIYPWLDFGELKMLEKKELPPGSVKTIAFGKDFIHQNMHVTDPCVTLCLRTIDRPKYMLSNYYNQGMRLQTSRLTIDIPRKMDAINYLSTMRGSQASIKKILHDFDDHTIFSCLNQPHRFLNTKNMHLRNILYQEVERRAGKELYQKIQDVFAKQSKLNKALTHVLKPASSAATRP